MLTLYGRHKLHNKFLIAVTANENKVKVTNLITWKWWSQFGTEHETSTTNQILHYLHLLLILLVIIESNLSTTTIEISFEKS